MLSLRPNLRRGAVSLADLLALLLLFISLIVGLRYGIRWGGSLGTLGAAVGGVIGVVAGVAFTVVAMLLAAWVSWRVVAFTCWWRPYPPPCERGTCIRPDQQRLEHLPEEIGETRPDLSCCGYRCQCGNLYAPLGSTRWVRVLPDGTLEPYLVHRPFGRWRPDPAKELPPYRHVSEAAFFGRVGAVSLAVGVAALLLTRFVSLGALQTIGAVGIMSGVTLLLLVGIDRISRRKRPVAAASETEQGQKGKATDVDEAGGDGHIPGWTIPLIVTLLTGGTAFFVIWSEAGLDNPVSQWFIPMCAALGLILGTAAWRGRVWRQKRISRTGRDPVELLWFVGLKIISLVPGAAAVMVWITPLPHQSLFDRVTVTLITGGLFLGLFFMGGLSFSQPNRAGLNRCSRILAGLGLALAIVGFVLTFVAAP